MNPASRQELIDYCKRSLGEPVIELNVDDDQLEDRIDEAIQFYREFHYDAIEKVFIRASVSPTYVTVSSGANSFVTNDIITASSGQTAIVLRPVNDTLLEVKKITGNIAANATITSSDLNVTANVVACSVGSYDNQYFEMSPLITGVSRVLPFTDKSSGLGIFDIRYQILVNDLYTLQSTDLIYYSQIKQHLELLNQLLVGAKPVRFNRHMNRLYLDMSWDVDVRLGDVVIIEAFRFLDPNVYTDVYNDMMFKKYATALIKRQWGINLKKFEGIQLPGGVILNGQRIYDEAIQEIEKLEADIRSTWEEPVNFLVG
jgi:hypothetical protein